MKRKSNKKDKKMHLDVEPVRYTTTTSTTTVAQKRHFKDEKKKLFLVDKLYEKE